MLPIDINFEREIAYFYGASDIDPIWKAFNDAISKLNKEESEDKIYKNMIPLLKRAYQSIHDQTKLCFDVHSAADYEFRMIYGNFSDWSVEGVQDVQNCLYHCVFNSDSPKIEQATELRVFLYQYKERNTLDEKDRKLLIAISNRSKELLNSLLPDS